MRKKKTPSINSVGRPKLFKSPEELENSIYTFIAKCEADEIPVTISGLASYLGIWRQRLSEYEKKPEYSDIIKSFKGKCEECLEVGMLTNRVSAVGAIFSLKNHYGWKDKHEQEVQLNTSEMSDAELMRIANNIIKGEDEEHED